VVECGSHYNGRLRMYADANTIEILHFMLFQRYAAFKTY